MGAGRRFTQGEIEAALRSARGNMNQAAIVMGVPRSTVWRHVQKSDYLKELCTDLEEACTDDMIFILYASAEGGNLTAAMYWLNNSPAAKRRGWGPRTEVTGAQGDAVSIVIKYADA